MNRALQRNEEIIKKLQIDKQNLINELTNTRDLSSTIESKKEQIIRQLTSKEIENENRFYNKKVLGFIEITRTI